MTGLVLKRSDVLKLLTNHIELARVHSKVPASKGADIILDALEEVGMLPTSCYYGASGEYDGWDEGALEMMEECELIPKWEPE